MDKQVAKVVNGRGAATFSLSQISLSFSQISLCIKLTFMPYTAYHCVSRYGVSAERPRDHKHNFLPRVGACGVVFPMYCADSNARFGSPRRAP